MYATAFAILRDPNDASDAVQDAVASLWHKHHETDVPDNPEAYCTMVVRNVCIDRLRSSSRHSFDRADALVGVATGDEADAAVSYRSTLDCLRRCIDGFPKAQRRVLSLSLISQLSNQEVCEVTGLSATNVRQIISRGRMRLREMLSQS